MAQQNVGSSRFTPVLGEPTALYPRSPASIDADVRTVAAVNNVDQAQVVVEVDRDGVPADGQTPVHVTVRVFDANGAPAAGTTFATLENSGGRILLPGSRTDELGPGAADANKVMPGVQLAVKEGVAQFELLAPDQPQDVLLRVSANGLSAEGTIGFVPEMREMIATGLVEGVINFGHRDNSGLIAPVDHDDVFERDIRRWEKQFNHGKANAAARTAFFVKGRIKGEYLLTAAYDSDKEVRGRLLRDIQPEEFYPVYGDASLRGFDARSAERLYVRVDNQRSYLLYGDFQTGDTLATATGIGSRGSVPQRSLGTYNRTATGLGWHYENARLRSNVFAIQDSLRQVIEEFASQGSGPYALRNSAVLEGSERVEVVVRDRNQPSRIVSVQPLARLVDYSFEPFSGRILLNQFLPTFDSNLNPVSLRITYELDQGTETFWVYGADGQLRLTDALEVGGAVVEDRNPFAAFRMGSANAGYRFGENTALAVEFARTQSDINTNSINQVATPGLQDLTGEVEGDAWRVEFGHDGERIDANLFAGRTDPGFNNPASPLFGGRGEYNLDVEYHLDPRWDLYLEGLRSEDRNPDGGERNAGGAGVRVDATDKLTLDAGWRSIRETVGAYSPWTTPLGYRQCRRPDRRLRHRRGRRCARLRPTAARSADRVAGDRLQQRHHRHRQRPADRHALGIGQRPPRRRLSHEREADARRRVRAERFRRGSPSDRRGRRLPGVRTQPLVRPLRTPDRPDQCLRHHHHRSPGRCAGVWRGQQLRARHPGVLRVPPARCHQWPRCAGGLGYPQQLGYRRGCAPEQFGRARQGLRRQHRRCHRAGARAGLRRQPAVAWGSAPASTGSAATSPRPIPTRPSTPRRCN